MTESGSVQRGKAKIGARALILTCLWIATAAAAGQEQLSTGVVADPSSGISAFAPLFKPPQGKQGDYSGLPQVSTAMRWSAASGGAAAATGSAGPRHITLEEAQQQAGTANNPMLRLAMLGVEAAKQHRLGVQSDFFPKLSATFANLHFNKFMGETVLIRRPVRGDLIFGVPLVFKNETVAAATAVQPVTPLFKLRQALNIARADERIASAKAGLPAKEVASNVEQSYFALLVARRQYEIVEANVKTTENRWRLASSATLPAGLAEYETAWLEAEKALVLASARVKEATASLNALLGWPPETQLELTIPTAFRENVSTPEAVAEAMRTSPEVVEAEQTLVKARAASALSKLDYVPDVAVIGGYAYQTVFPVLPSDFSYVGISASYNLFDFGKRERTIKERNAQVSMAELGLQLVKAKVAASVTKACFEVERARQMSQLAGRMDLANRAMEVSYGPDEARVARAKSEAQMLEADLEHRLAFSRLQQLIGAGRPSSSR